MSVTVNRMPGLAGLNRTFAMRAAIAAALAALGAFAGLSWAPGGSTLVLVCATLAALGTEAGVVLGALALVAGVGTPPIAMPTLIVPALGAGLAGIGLGLLARELDRARGALTSLTGAALMALLGAAALALPSIAPWLASPDGALLTGRALVVDGPSFTRLALDAPLRGAPMTSTPATIAAVAAVLAAVLALYAEQRDAVKPRRWAWAALSIAGALGLAAALIGLLDLLAAAPELDREALRRTLDFAGARDGGVLDLVVPAHAELRLWSRPFVDGLRLLPALLVLLMAFRASRVPLNKPPRTSTPALSGLAFAALAAAALGTALFAATHGIAGPSLAMIAGLVLGSSSLVAARTWGAATSPAPLSPLLGLAGAALLWVFAWLVVPLFGA